MKAPDAKPNSTENTIRAALLLAGIQSPNNTAVDRAHMKTMVLYRPILSPAAPGMIRPNRLHPRGISTVSGTRRIPPRFLPRRIEDGQHVHRKVWAHALI